MRKAADGNGLNVATDVPYRNPLLIHFISTMPAYRFAFPFFVVFLFAVSSLHAQEEAKLNLADEAYCQANDLMRYLVEARKWEKDIVALASKNEEESSANGILFLGSSSIRLWDSIEQDMKPYVPIRRGYGGAKYCDLAIYTKPAIRGLKFRAAVLFVGNDVSGVATDKDPAEVARLCRLVVQSLREEVADVPILIVSVTATPSRFKYWDRISAVNASLRDVSETSRDITYLDTSAHYIGEDGKPRGEFFKEDNLHQNADGYRLWSGLIRRKLDTMLGDLEP
jgi:hypothetical protein